ncbi:MAG: hypothetical protein M3O23_09580 [Actinomycetota bacterium]|nr:hypothetical protein [Actinomycetota bacterium]
MSLPGRGTRRAQEAVTSRIAKGDELLVSADSLTRVHLSQERNELQTEQVRLRNGSQVDHDQLERDFVRVARSYGDRHGQAVQPAQAEAEEAGRDRAVGAENPLPLESPGDLAAAGRSSRPGPSPSSGT